jgi:hypothetical protein
MSPARFQRLSHGSWSELSLANKSLDYLPTDGADRDVTVAVIAYAQFRFWRRRFRSTKLTLQPTVANFRPGSA